MTEKRKVLSTHVPPKTYDNVCKFLDKYRDKTGQDLSMSRLLWKLLAQRMNEIMAEWNAEKPPKP